MEQRNFELFAAHILVPYGKDEEFSKCVSASRPAKDMNFQDFAIHISIERGVRTVVKGPENMALATIPIELHAKVPAAAGEKLRDFVGNISRNTEPSFEFVMALLRAALPSDLQLQREYFPNSKGRSWGSLLPTLAQAALPGVAETFGRDLLCSHEILTRAAPGYSSNRILSRSEIPPRAEKKNALADVCERWKGLCPITANDKWRKTYGSIRFPQLKLRDATNFPTYRVSNIEDLKPILGRNLAIPFPSTSPSPPSAPRSESFLEFPADDSLNHFMTERPAAPPVIKSFLYPFLIDVGLPGIIDSAKTPPSAVNAATKEFRSAITEESSAFPQSRARACTAPALPPAAGDPEEDDAGPLHHWAGMEHFYEDGAFEG